MAALQLREGHAVLSCAAIEGAAGLDGAIVDGAAVSALGALRRTIAQEAARLRADAVAEERKMEEDDPLSRAAALLEWGARRCVEP
jgi:hypothetical protein